MDLNITIEQLLTHRSGSGEVVVDTILNNTLVNPYYEYNRAFLFNKIPKSTGSPGEKYEYNNSGYVLLGYILEWVNNRSYQDLLQEKIFKPAGMNTTYAYYSPTIANAAHPMFEGIDYADQISFNQYKDYSFSAGSIASNLNDLELFFTHLYEKNTFIKRETFNKMIDYESEYGLGIELTRVGKNKVLFLGHDGDTFSFGIQNYYNTLTKDLIIVFSNQYVDPYSFKVTNKLIKKTLELNGMQ